MHKLQVGGAGARRFLQAAALLLLFTALAAPMVAAPATGTTPAAAAAAVDPLRTTRLVRRLHLRLGGAAVTALPPHELQRAHNDCALTIVARLHRRATHPVPALPAPHTLARQLELGPRGVALEALARTLRQLGWPARVQRARTPLHPPAIALVHPGHYVLLLQQSPATVEYFDPLIGLVQEPRPHFAARWTGNGVQLSTGDN
jgi:hypothetical protein